MNKIFFIILLFTSLTARSEDWTLVSTDNSSKIFLSNEKTITENGKKFFKVKSIFNEYRDLMGLKYNRAINLYVISCELNLLNYKQQFAFHNDELIWTFPASTKVEQASIEIPKKVLEQVCH